MKIGEEVKTTRGWAKMEIASTRVRPFADARKYWVDIFAKIPDDELCMFKLTVKLPPKDKTKLVNILGDGGATTECS